MKPVLFAIAAATALLAVPLPPSIDFAAHRPAAPINSVVGDASYLAAFGRAPDARVPDDVRITTHLAWVLDKLRAAPVGHLGAAERAARVRNLDRLARYIRERSFPRNPSTVHARTPNFLDAEGRICAVGYLLRADLGAGAAAAIRDRFQFARIGEMTSNVLAAWQRTSGLSIRELASIQPSYGCCNDPPPQPDPVLGVDGSAVETASNVVNVGLAGWNSIAMARGKPSRTFALLAIGAGIAGGLVAARENADRPVLSASTGFLAAISGLAVLGRHDSLKRRGPASAVSLSLGPTAFSANAVAVQVRF